MVADNRRVLGIDVGTQSLRAAVFDLQGVSQGFGVEPIKTTHPQPAWAEQDANEWLRNAAMAVPRALAQAQCTADDIVGIGLDCTGCTVIPSLDDGTPIRPALLWMDQRSYREAEALSATGDPILRYVSGAVSPEWMLPKALWVKRHQPEIYAKTQKMVECTDWLMYQLTGEWTLSLNHVTVKWNYARPDGGWSDKMLADVGLDDLKSKWPTSVVPLGKGTSRLSTAAAKLLGLKAGTPVAQGGIDAYLGMIGLGAVGKGDLAMIMGSSTCQLAQSDREIFGSGMLGCYPDATVEGLYTIEGGQTATGSIVDWYRKHLAGVEAAEAQASGLHVYEVLDAKAAAIPPGADGLVCLDYWQGNRCPLKDPLARGAIWGLTLSHTAGHIFRSIYEATALGTRHLLDDAAQYGLVVDRIFAGGGGVKSRLWMQIHADAVQKPIYRTAESESCALGSAIVAAVHADCYPDLSEAAKHMVRITDSIEPNPKNRAPYDDLFGRYLATYDSLKDLMHSAAK